MYENLKVALGTVAQRRQFFVWRLYGRRPDGKYEKEPLGRISHNDPANWMSFDDAVSRCVGAPDGEAYAPGLYLTADLGAFLVDIDHLPEPHTLDADGTAIHARFPGAMVEWSSSERGLHIMGRHDPSRTGGHKCTAANVELYTRDRGVVLSANAVGSADTDHTEALRQLIAERFAPATNMTVAGGVPADPMLATSAMHAWLRKVEAAEPGTRNSVLNDAAFTLGGHVATGALDEGVARRELVKATAGWDNPDKVLRTINSSLRKGKESPILVPAPLPAPIPRIAPSVNVRSGSALMQRTFAPIQWALRDLVPQGTSILSAPPKVGKSFLVLQACIAIAAGVPLWAGREPEIAGDTLYLDLEGADRRLQERISGMLKAFPAAISLDRFFYETEWPRAEAGVAKLREWLTNHPQARLVVIDTLASFRDPDPGRKSAYMADYAVGEMLKPLVREFPVAIIVVSHTRKMAAGDPMDRISGTQGLVGSMDNYLILSRSSGAMDAELVVNGRDIREPKELALQTLKNGGWRCVGNSYDIKRSDERNDVLKALTSLGGVGTSREVHGVLDSSVTLNTLRKRLERMVEAGEIIKSGTFYTLLETAAKAEILDKSRKKGPAL